MNKIDRILKAAKAEAIPEGMSGLWFIVKAQTDKVLQEVDGKTTFLPPGLYTHLYRMTEATMDKCPPGVVVMEDTPFELRTHLQFMLRAYGHILVTGLGLGCVVRGLLANETVVHVTVVEKSPDVLKLVAPYMPKERLEIIEADALKWTKKNTRPFDFAWHDLWTNRETGEPHLDLWHTKLIFNCADKVKHQGAWRYHRIAKRWLQRRGRIKLIA